MNYRVNPGTAVHLQDYPSDDKGDFGNKVDAKSALKALKDKLDDLQEILYAEHKHAVLFVIQAMDTGGKDGTIRQVFGHLNPAGCRVWNFKAPSALELDHDYLWRIHTQVPRKGEIGIFNRSQYEDVLIVRVHHLVPQSVWEKRYDQINAFEKMLADEGTTILKFFLHISKEEQKKRLEERILEPKKNWKFNPGDLKERDLWDEYMQAYEAVLSMTSTTWAPWYIVPADRNWVRNMVVATAAIDAITALNPQYPPPLTDLKGITIN